MAEAPVLICYDGSSEARRAIDVAAALLGPRRAVVLDIGPLQYVAEAYAAMGSGAATVEQLEQRDVLAQAEQGAVLARAAGFDAQGRGDVAGTTWRAVVDVADEIGAAVIVTGSRGFTGLKSALEGSLSHELAAHAGRPLLIVPPARDDA